MANEKVTHEILDFSKGYLEISSKCVYTEGIETLGTIHFHKCFEIVHVIKGKVKCVIESESVEMIPGSTIVIYPEAYHSYQSVCQQGSAQFVCLFGPSLLNYDNSNLPLYEYKNIFTLSNDATHICLAPPYKYQIEIYNLIKKISLECAMEDKDYELQVRGLLYQLIGFIKRNDIENHSKAFSYKQQYENIKQLCQKIESQCNQSFSLSATAKSMNYSKEHFSRLFKKVTGENFKNFVDYVKITEAERMLLFNNVSTKEVADEVGFSNTNNFYRVFKRIKGYSPSSVKRQT